MKYTVKNWSKFQHYKERTPPWIKLHRSILDDCCFIRLPIASRAIAPFIWLLASESKDGTFEGDYESLAFRLRLDKKEIESGIKGLLSSGYVSCLTDASAMIAECKQETRLEAERETERETDFCAFWDAYPKKVGKGKASEIWKKKKPPLDKCLETIKAFKESDQWKKENGQFIPMPATWLNQGRWEDELMCVSNAGKRMVWKGCIWVEENV